MRLASRLCAAAVTAAVTMSPLVTSTQQASAVFASKAVSASPVHDAHVVAQRKHRKTGDHKTLRTSWRSLHRTAYLKFRVTGVPAGVRDVTARLRLTSVGQAKGPTTVHRVTDLAWSQQRLSFARRPAVKRAVGTLRAGAPGAVRGLDVSSAVRGDGTYAFALVTARRGGVAAFRSAERGSGAPELRVSWSDRHRGRAGSPTLFGTNVYRGPGVDFRRALDRQHAAYGKLGVVRVFYPSLPARWPGPAGESGGPIVVSFKSDPRDVVAGRHDAYLRKWFATAPEDRKVWWTYWHEPEDEIQQGYFSAAEYRAAWRHIATLAARAKHPKLRPTLILMCWTLAEASQRDWKDYYPGDTVIDTLGWDCYNAGAHYGRYRDPQLMFSDVAAAASSVGKPWGIAELGSLLVEGDSGARRARWLRDSASWLRRAGAAWVSYFDAPVSGGEYRLLDPDSRAAWREAVRKP